MSKKAISVSALPNISISNATIPPQSVLEMDLETYNIVSLEGLQAYTNVSRIYLKGSSPTDIGLISGAKKLSSVIISETELSIEDLSKAFAGAKQIQTAIVHRAGDKHCYWLKDGKWSVHSAVDANGKLDILADPLSKSAKYSSLKDAADNFVTPTLEKEVGPRLTVEEKPSEIAVEPKSDEVLGTPSEKAAIAKEESHEILGPTQEEVKAASEARAKAEAANIEKREAEFVDNFMRAREERLVAEYQAQQHSVEPQLEAAAYTNASAEHAYASVTVNTDPKIEKEIIAEEPKKEKAPAPDVDVKTILTNKKHDDRIALEALIAKSGLDVKLPENTEYVVNWKDSKRLIKANEEFDKNSNLDNQAALQAALKKAIAGAGEYVVVHKDLISQTKEVIRDLKTGFDSQKVAELRTVISDLANNALVVAGKFKAEVEASVGLEGKIAQATKGLLNPIAITEAESANALLTGAKLKSKDQQVA